MGSQNCPSSVHNGHVSMLFKLSFRPAKEKLKIRAGKLPVEAHAQQRSEASGRHGHISVLLACPKNTARRVARIEKYEGGVASGMRE